MSSHPIPRGRRRALDRQKKRLLLDAVSRGATMGEAALSVGVSLRTVQREARMDPDFDQQLRIAHSDKPDPLSILRSAARTHWRAAAWLLERENPEDYGRRPAHCCTPFQFDEALKVVVEAALRLTPPENRARVYAYLSAACDTAFQAVFPNYGRKGMQLLERLPKTPLAEAQSRQAAVRVPDPFEAPPVAPAATPDQFAPPPRAAGFIPAVTSRATSDAKHPTSGRAGVGAHLQRDEAAELSLTDDSPSGIQQPESSIEHPPSAASASDRPCPTPTRMAPAPSQPTAPPSAIEHPASSIKHPASRLPWRYILRAAGTAKTIVPSAAASASVAERPFLSLLSPKTHAATKIDARQNDAPLVEAEHTPSKWLTADDSSPEASFSADGSC